MVFFAVGLVLIYYSYDRLSNSINPPSTKSVTVHGGLLLGWSDPIVVQNKTAMSSMRNLWVQMVVDVVEKKVKVEFDFQSRFGESHSFRMILPFTISNPRILQNESVGGTVTSVETENLTESSSVLGCTWVDLHNYSDWESAGASVVVNATGNLVSSQKGEDELYLPIGIYPSGGDLQDAEKSLPEGVSFPSPTSDFAVNFSQISVILPADAKLEQLIPSYANVEKTTNSLTVNIQSLFDSESVTIDYQDVSLVSMYANDLFLGSVGAISGSGLIAVGIGTTLYLRRRGGEGADLVQLKESPRRLASVMFMDIVGYSSITHKDEGLALRALHQQRDLVRPFFQKHTGREIKTVGDGVLIEFASALEAVTCAFEIQSAFHESNSSRPVENRVHMRIGIHLGDVLHTRDDVFGDAVNMASRVEPLAPPGGVAFTRQIFEEIKNKVNFPILELGPQKLKNIGEFELYRIVFPWEAENGRAT